MLEEGMVVVLSPRGKVFKDSFHNPHTLAGVITAIYLEDPDNDFSVCLFDVEWSNGRTNCYYKDALEAVVLDTPLEDFL